MIKQKQKVVSRIITLNDDQLDLCKHEWRFARKRETGPYPGGENEPFKTEIDWYCVFCRQLETTEIVYD